MLIIALLGMPLVIGYTVFIYRVFKGKVEITPDSY
jgi:cytochrome d ubiquinol oxidase subunit II